MRPTVKFVIDPSKDWDALQGFLNDSKFDGGRGLEWAVYSKRPELRSLVHAGLGAESEVKIRVAIQEFFVSHSSEIQSNLDIYRSAWLQKQDAFFSLVEDIFGDASWPPGLYEAYATSWGMFPRSLEDKTFYVPAIFDNKSYVDIIVAHELLHFMFYRYFYAKYPEHDNEDDNFLAWNVSEIFNSVVQNSQPWLDVFGLKSMTYPEHEKIETDLQVQFSIIDKQNLEQVTSEILRISKDIKMG